MASPQPNHGLSCRPGCSAIRRLEVGQVIECCKREFVYRIAQFRCDLALKRNLAPFGHGYTNKTVCMLVDRGHEVGLRDARQRDATEDQNYKSRKPRGF